MRERCWRERSRKEEREMVRRSRVRKKGIPCEEEGRDLEARAWRCRKGNLKGKKMIGLCSW